MCNKILIDQHVDFGKTFEICVELIVLGHREYFIYLS